jgi:putative membrane protein
MGMGMMGFGLLMMLVGLLVVAGLIGIVVWALIYFTGAGRSSPLDPHAREILDRRYATGEIDHEEYQRIRRALS